MTRLRMLAIGLIATAALLGSVATATAATITISPGGPITATNTSTLTFFPGRINIGCPFTMTASLSSGPIVAPLNTLTPWGSVITAVPGFCTGGYRLTFLGVSAWAIAGSVASTGSGVAAQMRITPFQFELLIGGLTCRYSGDLHAHLSAAGNQLSFNAANAIPFSSGDIQCPRPATLSGTMALAPAQTVTAV